MLMSQSDQMQNRIVGGLGLLPVGIGTDGGGIYKADTSDDTSSMFIAGYAPDGTPLWSWSSGVSVAQITDPSMAAGGSASGSQMTASIGNFLDKIFGAYNAQQAIDLNKQRLAAGLPPVTPSALAPQVNFGLSSNTLLLLGAGLGAYLLMKKR
jgi:hypothetical protein